MNVITTTQQEALPPICNRINLMYGKKEEEKIKPNSSRDCMLLQLHLIIFIIIISSQAVTKYS